MKLAVVGLGLGFHLSYYLTRCGHEVRGVDIREAAFKDRQPDPRLAGLVPPPRFSTHYRTVEGCDYVLIFVSTPFDPATSRLSIANVRDAIRSASEVNPFATYLVLSTLPIGGMAPLREEFPKLRMFYCPPMVKKADFLSTFVRPPSQWQLIGTSGDDAALDVVQIYEGLLDRAHVQILVREDRVVEAAKLCTNLLLSTKIILANAIGAWLVDPEAARGVCEVVGMDPRVGVGYLTPFVSKAAGPCFPRDLLELATAAEATYAGADLAEILAVLNRVNRTAELVES